MTNEQKAQLYNQWLFEYHQLGNRISAMKADNLNPSQKVMNEIRVMERQQQLLMAKVQKLMM
jgi:hypothetical protein